VLEQDAARQKQSLASYVADIDKNRGTSPLASALRLTALAAAKSAP
jgi:predicted DNA-binding ribbon-helix-helix protein